MDDTKTILFERVATLESLEAIRDLKSHYARGADACLGSPSHENAVRLAALFTEDAIADYGALGRFVGRAQIINGFEKVLPLVASWSQHYMLNPLLEVSGDYAQGSWYFHVAAALKAAPGAVTNMYGSYRDTYVKTADGWKFSSLVVSYAEPPK